MKFAFDLRLFFSIVLFSIIAINIEAQTQAEIEAMQNGTATNVDDEGKKTKTEKDLEKKAVKKILPRYNININLSSIKNNFSKSI